MSFFSNYESPLGSTSVTTTVESDGEEKIMLSLARGVVLAVYRQSEHDSLYVTRWELFIYSFGATDPNGSEGYAKAPNCWAEDRPASEEDMAAMKKIADRKWRTLPGLMMEWVFEVSDELERRGKFVDVIRLNDGWGGHNNRLGSSSLQRSAGNMLERQAPPPPNYFVSLLRQILGKAKADDPATLERGEAWLRKRFNKVQPWSAVYDRSFDREGEWKKYLERVERSGFYGQFGFCEDPEDWDGQEHQMIVKPENRIVLRGPFVDRGNVVHT